MKTFLLDTNVLLHDPFSLKVFGKNFVTLPISILDEIDNNKERIDEVGRNARTVTKILDGLREKGSLSDGVSLGETIIRVELNHSNHVPHGLDPSKKDNRLISTALGLRKEGQNVIVITKDINLRVKCDALDIQAQDYKKGKVAEDLTSIYGGVGKLEVESEIINKLFLEKEVKLDVEGYPNQFFILKSNSSENQSALARYIGNNTLKPCKNYKNIWGIAARNAEQKMALDVLLDQNVKLVTLIGRAGSGKAQPLDAKILTPEGWSLMGELKLNDTIITPKGKKSKIIGIFPQGMKDVYKVSFNDETSTECCDDHLWFTKNYSVKTLRDIRNSLHLEYEIPVIDKISFKDDLPMDPYLMGKLLSEEKYQYISHNFKFSSYHSRLKLLDGLIGNKRIFSTKFKTLAEDVEELVRSLSGKATTIFDGDYIVHISKDFQKKMKKVEYIGRKFTQCILIDDPDHLYVTNDFIVTHNTLLSCATALYSVLDKKIYQRVLVSRPIQPMGKDLGFLPGTIEEKLNPWMQPLYDNFEFLLGPDAKLLNMYMEEGLIQIEPLTYIRGRSIPNSLIILDEAQNLTAQEMKTIVTRLGENSKIIITGDIGQIDRLYIDFADNGLSHVVERFKEYDIAGHITLIKGERSKLATLASEIL